MCGRRFFPQPAGNYIVHRQPVLPFKTVNFFLVVIFYAWLLVVFCRHTESVFGEAAIEPAGRLCDLALGCGHAQRKQATRRGAHLERNVAL